MLFRSHTHKHDTARPNPNTDHKSPDTQYNRKHLANTATLFHFPNPRTNISRIIYNRWTYDTTTPHHILMTYVRITITDVNDDGERFTLLHNTATLKLIQPCACRCPASANTENHTPPTTPENTTEHTTRHTHKRYYIIYILTALPLVQRGNCGHQKRYRANSHRVRVFFRLGSCILGGLNWRVRSFRSWDKRETWFIRTLIDFAQAFGS